MNTKSNPTPAQIRTAIAVLQKLSARVDAETTHAVVQLPLSELGTRYMDEIETKAFERSLQIDAVATQLKGWQNELSLPTAPAGFIFSWPGHAPVAGLMGRISNLALWAKGLVAAKTPSLDQSGAVIMFFKKPENFAAKFFKEAGSLKKSRG